MAWDNGHSRTSTTAWKRLRTWAKTNLNYHCAYGPHHDGPLELDHIINTRQGGTNDPDNLQWLCTHCHKAKTQKESAARRGPYRRKPKPPLGPM